MDTLTLTWDEKMKKCDDDLQTQYAAIKERQETKIREFNESTKQLSSNFHPSKETLRLKKTEEELARQGKYIYYQI